MDVREIGESRGVVHATARVGGGHHPPARGAGEARPDAHATAPSTTPASSSGAVFDANGDGVVEHWSYALGGDSFTTFDPPPSGSFGSDVAGAHRTAETRPDPAITARAQAGQSSTPHAGTPVAIHHANHAYRTDGGALGSDAKSSPPPPPAPMSSVPEHGDAAALPSPGS